MDFLKYADKKSKSLGGFEKKSEVTKEAVAEKKDEFDVVIVKAEPEEKKEYIIYKEKRYNAETGEAMDDSTREWTLEQLEAEKARYDKAMEDAKKQSDAIAVCIADFKKL
jgi:dolichyl-phosphate-mannose--protein O-mannosyl transferase